MVARCKKIIAVDFDGTLLRGNSLQLYLQAGIAELCGKRAFSRIARIAWAVALRRLRMVSHEHMKFNLLALIGRDASLLRRYNTLIAGKLNPEIVELIEKSNAEPVVVSAAFRFCIESAVAYSVLATPPEGPELRGEAKADSLKRYLADNKAQLEAVVTDSASDLPLLRMPCPHKYIVSPSRRDVKTLQRYGFKITPYSSGSSSVSIVEHLK